MALKDKTVVLGVGGGIAAYKVAYLARELGRRGAVLRVVLSRAGRRFVGPVTFAGLTGEPPVTDLWDPSYPGEIHVDLADAADLVIVAPATADLLGKAALGLADDALTATLLCYDGPLLFAPAMHHRMWASEATQRNVARLVDDGADVVGPVEGPLASGASGMGRMAEPEAIADAAEAALSARDLEGRTVLVTAGGTQEDLDPVRFLGNRSSGRMGYAVAERAARRGARVFLVSGPTPLPVPSGVERTDVRSAREMEAAVIAHRQNADAIVMAAAVADYRPSSVEPHKLKKSGGPLHLELVRNPDILAGLGQWRGGGRPVLVGFAVETRDLVAAARGKLEQKGADLIVANQAGESFGRDTNRVVLVGPAGDDELPELSKGEVAERILDRVVALLEAE
ncbi:MAG: bifunctional phosphopantothenoylcysteine decarboxylase/phosphopantothenate--cysteine ligase CoaBC [Sandaracinaceae bacterium]